MPSTSAGPSSSQADRFTRSERDLIMSIAWRSLVRAVRTGEPMLVDLKGMPPALTANRATFVTLRLTGHLRGCIGCLEAREPLIQSVATHARMAALEDPRFPPVCQAELPPGEHEGKPSELTLSVSILSLPVKRQVDSEDRLLGLLADERPGVILQSGTHRATFLPDVWQELTEPKAFWRHLKAKAGLPADIWPRDLEISTYQTCQLT